MAKKVLYEAKDKVIEKETGKKFDEWWKILEKWKASKKGHFKSAEYLEKKHELPKKWADALVTKYEKKKFLGK